MQWVIAAALICSSTVFTSCSDDDNSVDPAKNLSEKIIGKWIIADKSGQAAPTNSKTVTTFLSATKATVSMSRSEYTSESKRWNAYQEYDVNINGDKVTLTRQVNESVTLVNEYVIKSITNTEIVCDFRHVTIHDGQPDYRDWQAVRLVKLNVDYKEAVLGLWECTGLTGIETYNDANARLEFLDDGTYRYYRQDDAGQWQAVTTREFQNYFADGTLLATRWKNQGEDELREWWEIESLSGDQMVWKALRQKEDGSTSVQKMTWKKIDLKLAEKIIGKWIFVERNGEPTPSNKKRVYNFVSSTKAYISASDGMGPVAS